jgi:hypothetical protein
MAAAVLARLKHQLDMELAEVVIPVVIPKMNAELTMEAVSGIQQAAAVVM